MLFHSGVVGVREAYSSPGLGGSRCPWRDAGLEEKFLLVRCHEGVVAETTLVCCCGSRSGLAGVCIDR
jgi:hypothetical protein